MILRSAAIVRAGYSEDGIKTIAKNKYALDVFHNMLPIKLWHTILTVTYPYYRY